MFGYVLTGDTSQQKILMIIGPKRSGKGTIGRVITALLGRDNIASPQLSNMADRFGLQPLIGKLLVLLPDARIGTNDPRIVERLLTISGEDNISVDRKNKEYWSGTLSARFLLFTNETPQFLDASGALSGRFITLSLKESFYGKEDLTLTSRLLLELPGIFKWALDGKDKLSLRGHFIQPASGREAMEELAEMSSPIGTFVKEMCDVGEGFTVSIDELYIAWGQWCQVDAGIKAPIAKAAFCKGLRSVVPKLKRTQPRLASANEDLARARDTVYEGIRIKVESEI
jgi:P4 family phage/plasmid primase-like protien